MPTRRQVTTQRVGRAQKLNEPLARVKGRLAEGNARIQKRVSGLKKKWMSTSSGRMMH